MNVAVRVNGNAPAWPVLLEGDHPFYAPYTSESLGSVSYSLLAKEDKNSEKIFWEVLVDAGHNAVPYLIQHGNRIPDAIVLTHAHNDHVLSVDWIVQSFHYKHKRSKGFPLYATKGVWKDELPHSILGLNKYLNIRKVYLMHYFGYYDKINYDEELMDRKSLENWANQVAREKHIKNVVYKVPRIGNLIYL